MRMKLHRRDSSGLRSRKPRFHAILCDFPIRRDGRTLGADDVPNGALNPRFQCTDLARSLDRVDVEARDGPIILVQLPAALLLEFVCLLGVARAYQSNARLMRADQVDQVEPVLERPPFILVSGWVEGGWRSSCSGFHNTMNTLPFCMNNR